MIMTIIITILFIVLMAVVLAEKITEIEAEIENDIEGKENKGNEVRKKKQELRQQIRKHIKLVDEFRNNYVTNVCLCVIKHFNTLMLKLEQLSYVDDYGIWRTDDFIKELRDFSTRIVPRECDLIIPENLLVSYEQFDERPFSYLRERTNVDKYEIVKQLSKKEFPDNYLHDDCLFNFEILINLNGDINIKSGDEQSLHIPIGINIKPLPRERFASEADTRFHIVTECFIWFAEQSTSFLNKRKAKFIKKDFMRPLNSINYEKHVSDILKSLGFNSRTTKISGDQGADVLAEKDGVKFAIQCKMYSKPVGNKAVQEANAAREFYKCDYAVVVSNAEYTKSARQLANTCGVILLNDKQLNKLNKYIE